MGNVFITLSIITSKLSLHIQVAARSVKKTKPFWTIPASYKLSLMIQNSIIHYTNFIFLRLIYYTYLLPKLDFAHFELDLLYTVHFKMHFFIEQYLSIILKLLKIVARMILQQYYKFMIAYRNFGQIRLPKPFRVNPQCVCVISM